MTYILGDVIGTNFKRSMSSEKELKKYEFPVLRNQLPYSDNTMLCQKHFYKRTLTRYHHAVKTSHYSDGDRRRTKRIIK